MQLLEALDTTGTVVEPCKLGKILDLLDDNEKNVLRECLSNTEAWSADRLSAQLKKTPYRVGPTTIKRHRNRLCGCY